MKLWRAYGSEHSANLVMIGRFKETSDAEEAKALIDKICQRVAEEPEAYQWDAKPRDLRFTDKMYELLKDAKLFSIGPAEFEQFDYGVQVQLSGASLILTTDEVDVSAFFKLLIDRGAKVEIFSAHQYPDDAPERRS